MIAWFQSVEGPNGPGGFRWFALGFQCNGEFDLIHQESRDKLHNREIAECEPENEKPDGGVMWSLGKAQDSILCSKLAF